MQAKTITICALALLAAACGGKGQADASANADTGLTASAISSNDVTAIDAVTGEAANMAADMDFTNAPANAADSAGNRAGSAKPGSRPRLESPSAPAQPVENRTEPATAPANATE